MTRRGVRAYRARTLLAAVGLTALSWSSPLLGGIAQAQDEGGGSSAPAPTPTPTPRAPPETDRTWGAGREAAALAVFTGRASRPAILPIAAA